MEGLYFIYITNILLAGWISISCLATPKRAAISVFSNSLVRTEAIKTVGGIWFALLSLSALGLFF
ncbi:MAG: hypothetical protein L7T87_02175, partial [Schleiferiaceae bacterium]|nr:hypothetical protein [Schleiferiaceae bacterium]